MIEPPPALEKNRSWLGSFASKGKIEGDIISPVQQNNSSASSGPG